MAQAPTQGRIAIESHQLSKQLPCGGEEHGMAVDQRLMARLRARVDLPIPFGPTSMMLADSLRKPSDITSSMAARSQRLG